MNYKRVYAQGYSYFFTLVTYKRKPLLIEHIENLREAFRRTQKHYRYAIEAIVILPDHLHIIMTPEYVNEYPQIIKQIKRSFVYGLPLNIKAEARLQLSTSQYYRGHAGIWQSRYYEHTIRDQKDWDEKINYIRDNPVKHGLCDTWNQWQYSSFTIQSNNTPRNKTRPNTRRS